MGAQGFWQSWLVKIGYNNSLRRPMLVCCQFDARWVTGGPFNCQTSLKTKHICCAHHDFIHRVIRLACLCTSWLWNVSLVAITWLCPLLSTPFLLPLCSLPSHPSTISKMPISCIGSTFIQMSARPPWRELCVEFEKHSFKRYALASFQGPTQFSVAFSMEKQERAWYFM